LPQLTAPDLGEFRFSAEDLITFPEGLPAFEHLHQFLLVTRDNLRPFIFLVSAEQPTVRFVCLPVQILRPDYGFELAASDCGWLAPPGGYHASSPELDVFVILTLSEGAPATANLMAPVLVNPERRLGAQVILAGGAYSHATPLWPAGREVRSC
jgi:flagellar assembly factor FliW